MSGVSDDFPVQLATRLPDWSAGMVCCDVVLLLCPCVVSFSKVHEPDTCDILARMSRGSVKFQLYKVRNRAAKRRSPMVVGRTHEPKFKGSSFLVTSWYSECYKDVTDMLLTKMLQGNRACRTSYDDTRMHRGNCSRGI